MTTLREILERVSSHLDLEVSDLNAGTELTYRANLANQAVLDWAAFYQWRQLKREVSTVASMASLSLPGDFYSFTGKPQVYKSSGVWDAYPEILPEERYSTGESDKYCYVLPDSDSGYTAIFNNIDANASLSYVYQRQPSLMASLANVCEVPDPQYVVLKTVAYVLQGRSDPRFPVINAQANVLLQNMRGRESRVRPGGSSTTRRVGASAYRIGT